MGTDRRPDADDEHLRRTGNLLGAGALAVILSGALLVLLFAWILVVVTDGLDVPSRGSERQAREELDRVDTPAGAAVVASTSLFNSGLPTASRTYAASAPCLSDDAGFVAAVEAAGFAPEPLDDPARLRWAREVDGGLRSYVTLSSTPDEANTCTLVSGFLPGG